MTPPENIPDMAALRREIDALDRELVALFARRARLIDRAVELKPGEGMAARIPARVEEVLENARREAAAAGWDADLAEALWRQLVEWSITREEKVLGRQDAA